MRTVDVFAGCGGLSLGFQDAGFNILSAYDSWEPAIRCYEANFNHPIYQMDLRDTEKAVLHIALQNPDLIIGGPPCQDFSHAGYRREKNNAQLTCTFADIITNIKPPWFVMENVDRVKNSEAYSKAKKLFKKVGYGITERMLDASFCGVPQRRKRFFCIGHLNGTDNFLDNTINNRLSDNPTTIRSYLGNEFGIEYYYRHPRNYNRRGIFSIDEPGPTVRGVNRPVPPGYKGHPSDPVPVTEGIRPLTTLERARIQTFPKSFVWLGSKTDLEQMIGNAVPVKMAQLVAEALREYALGLDGCLEEGNIWTETVNF